MPDLGTSLFNSETLTLASCSTNLKLLPDPSNPSDSLLPCPLKTLNFDNVCNGDFNSNPEVSIDPETTQVSSKVLKIRFTMSSSGSIEENKKVIGDKCLEDYVKEWKERKIASGVPENRCFFPFLVGSPKLAECRVCSKYVNHGDEISCSVRGCQGSYHLKCVKDNLRCSVLKNFKCPQHVCFVCKQKGFWRCVRCIVASHDKCAPWPEKVIHLSERPGWAICWRHSNNWQEQKHADPAVTFQDIFSRLPLPCMDKEFKIESMLKDSPNDKLEPLPYVHIRRNVYLVKKKRDDASRDVGCTNCSSTSTCSEDCVCRVSWKQSLSSLRLVVRVQCISCSKACHCSEACTNRPFRKEKKIKIVMTELCGWGVKAAESISKGDFIIEYVGEVIDDAECTQRLWDMKNKNVKNFFMCEIRKDFTIDATFKGNASRFLNHSCDPNCKLEKWQVEGETRVGVFAARSIKVGEPLTYDYRFVQFGPEVKCHCGAANCQGYLGAKRKINLDNLDSERRKHLAKLGWGLKRKRTFKTCFAIVSK